MSFVLGADTPKLTPIISSRDDPQNFEQGMSKGEVNVAHALRHSAVQATLAISSQSIPRERLPFQPLRVKELYAAWGMGTDRPGSGIGIGPLQIT